MQDNAKVKMECSFPRMWRGVSARKEQTLLDTSTTSRTFLIGLFSICWLTCKVEYSHSCSHAPYLEHCPNQNMDLNQRMPCMQMEPPVAAVWMLHVLSSIRTGQHFFSKRLFSTPDWLVLDTVKVKHCDLSTGSEALIPTGSIGNKTSDLSVLIIAERRFRRFIQSSTQSKFIYFFRSGYCGLLWQPIHIKPAIRCSCLDTPTLTIFHYPSLLSFCRAAGGLELVPADIGWDKVASSSPRTTETDSRYHSHPHGKQRVQ